MRKLGATFVAAGVLIAALSTGAGAAKPPWAGGGQRPAVTKMRFKLADHEVAVGETVDGTVKVQTGKGRNREPLEGATLRVLVDHVEVGTLTTDADGTAAVSHVADTEGEHVIKVVFDATSAQRKAKRAQGFEVSTAAEPTD